METQFFHASDLYKLEHRNEVPLGPVAEPELEVVVECTVEVKLDEEKLLSDIQKSVEVEVKKSVEAKLNSLVSDSAKPQETAQESTVVEPKPGDELADADKPE